MGTCVGPSELHLKKELTALRKSRLLRDPETCSSWRSPLSTRSVAAATSSFNCGNDAKRNMTSASTSSGLAEIELNSDNLLRSENKQKKVYLYNWGHHASKSSDSGIKVDKDNKQESYPASPKDILRNSQNVKAEKELYSENPVNALNLRGANSEAPTRRTLKKLRRKAISKQRNGRNSAISKLLDLPSSTLASLDFIEHNDDTDYCNSEVVQHSVPESTHKSVPASRPTSPLLSVSAYGNWSDSSKILKNAVREESCYSHTPLSTSSCNRYGDQNPSTVGSWDGSTGFDGEDEEDLMDLPGRQGCGLPCYSSKKRKDRGRGGWYSPSFSDILRKKGGSILCGSQTANNRRRSSCGQKGKVLPKSSQGLPLLSNSCDMERLSVDSESDELSTNFGELDLEALSRLDGRRWSSCRSQDGLELASPVAGNGVTSENRSLSHKYRPKTFMEIVGQNIVVHSLTNAILRGRIAPAYLFQGPRGTGKTSTARIFSAALNCLSSEDNKPCGSCRECTNFGTGKGSNMREVDATNKKGINRIRYLLKNVPVATAHTRYKIFVIDECHKLSSKIWSAFLKFLEEPLARVVFVFITIDPNNLPRAVLSRCQKYLFPKIKDADIVTRLKYLSSEEHFDVEVEALDLIALNSNGSLRDAETMLDQLSLLSKKITSSLVNDLVGVVSDEKLIDLLEIALSSDTAETVRKSRELLDSGIDPMRLMSQLAGLIMDIIAGTDQLASSESNDLLLRSRNLTEAEMDRLHQALKILSGAEKQLRHSSERSTWFTAALLQLGSGHSAEPIHSSGSSSRHSKRKLKTNVFDSAKDNLVNEKYGTLLKLQQSSSASAPRAVSGHTSPCANTSSSVSMKENPTFYALPNLSSSANKGDANSKRMPRFVVTEMLDDIWRRCIEGCHSKTLRSLLSSHGKLVSISEDNGALIAFIGFGDISIRSRAERYLSSMTNSFEIVLRQNVKVRIGLLPDKYGNGKAILSDSSEPEQVEILSSENKQRKKHSGNLISREEPVSLTRKSVDRAEDKVEKAADMCQDFLGLDGTFQVRSLPIFSNNGTEDYGSKVKEVPLQRLHIATLDEQRLESAWLQAAEKGTFGSGSLKPERNQILPQNGFNQTYKNESIAISSKHWEDELNQEIKALKIKDSKHRHKGEIGGRVDHPVISPSILHSSRCGTKLDEDDTDCESRPGCDGLLCWKVKKPWRSKGKELIRVRSLKKCRVLCFGCGKVGRRTG